MTAYNSFNSLANNSDEVKMFFSTEFKIISHRQRAFFQIQYNHHVLIRICFSKVFIRLTSGLTKFCPPQNFATKNKKWQNNPSIPKNSKKIPEISRNPEKRVKVPKSLKIRATIPKHPNKIAKIPENLKKEPKF